MSFIEPTWAFGIYVFFLVTGVSGNLFILTVHFLNWLKTSDCNPSMLIINSIALINIVGQAAITTDRVTLYMSVKFYMQDWVSKLFVVILSSLAFSSLWSSTCLCFYYCTKIANFNWSFFYKLKAKAPLYVPWLLIISIAASWSVGVSAYLDLDMDIEPVTGLTAGNLTLTLSYNLRSRCKCLFQIYMLFAAIAFTVIFLTAGAIVTSLCKHMIRMKKSNEASGNSRINSHLSAAKTVTYLLLLYVIFYGSLSSLFNGVEEDSNFIFFFSYIVVSAFPTFNSIILIMGNRKLSYSLKKLSCIRPHAANTEVTVTTH
ncbi:taste receptor type 2 member 39-like [Dendrobates tinctorius]|uniref:taste receptor type 2 member 39-like n=1 Tax=Dendrobates tinctorius TaxID=92724 RepID=UPI003CC992C8